MFGKLSDLQRPGKIVQTHSSMVLNMLPCCRLKKTIIPQREAEPVGSDWVVRVRPTGWGWCLFYSGRKAWFHPGSAGHRQAGLRNGGREVWRDVRSGAYHPELPLVSSLQALRRVSLLRAEIRPYLVLCGQNTGFPRLCLALRDSILQAF